MGTKCACEGLELLKDMADAYQLFMDGDPNHEDLMKILSSRIYVHIKEQASLPANKALRKIAEPRLEKQDEAIKSIYNDDEPIMSVVQTMELVRDDLHKTDALRRLLLCQNGKTNVQIDKADELLKTALDSLGTVPPYQEDTPADSKRHLDKIMKYLTC